MMIRPWLPTDSQALFAEVERDLDRSTAAAEVGRLVDRQDTTSAQSINLNPAANVMNPRAEALLARGLSTRPALGAPGAKHEAGVEALERIEAVAVAMAQRIFGARYAEVRLSSGTIANLCAYLALTRPGDAIIVPPPQIGGHASHLAAGAAGLRGLRILHAPVDGERYAIDLAGLEALASAVRPTLIVAGGSLNLFLPPIAELRAIADSFGALLLYDAAHVAGLVAGGAWSRPLAEGAHVMTLSTYKSLGGPAGGLVLTDDPSIAERIERVAFPGLSANSDIGRTAALAVALGDSHLHGHDYAAAMLSTAGALARSVAGRGVPVFAMQYGLTCSHQFAIDGTTPAGAERAVRRLAGACLFSSSIALPGDSPGQPRGIRMGTPEVARRGMTADDMPELANLIADAFLSAERPETIAPRTMAMRQRFNKIGFAVP
jgi:glycine hydroxymethyltransferase